TRESDSYYDRLGAPLHQILLKVHRAFIRLDDRRHRVVGHGKNARLHSERGPNRLRNLRKSLALLEQRAAMNMCGQVLVAQVEPVGAPVDRQFLQSMEGI